MDGFNVFYVTLKYAVFCLPLQQSQRMLYLHFDQLIIWYYHQPVMAVLALFKGAVTHWKFYSRMFLANIHYLGMRMELEMKQILVRFIVWFSSDLKYYYLHSWALLEKLPTVQLLKNFWAFYGTRRFITLFTRALRWSLSWARSI
jgi:hypothetical protein